MLGRKLSEETRQKMRDSHKGLKPSDWGAGFKPGSIPWNKSSLTEKEHPRDLIDKVYFAALIDGEGSIFITSNNNQAGKYRKLCVAVGMRSDKAQCLPDGHKIWGGSLNKRDPRKSNTHEVLDWRLWTKDAERFLKDIQPFLRVKHKQAELALKYRWMQTKKKRWDGSISEEDWVIRNELESQIKALNH